MYLGSVNLSSAARHAIGMAHAGMFQNTNMDISHASTALWARRAQLGCCWDGGPTELRVFPASKRGGNLPSPSNRACLCAALHITPNKAIYSCVAASTQSQISAHWLLHTQHLRCLLAGECSLVMEKQHHANWRIRTQGGSHMETRCSFMSFAWTRWFLPDILPINVDLLN